VYVALRLEGLTVVAVTVDGDPDDARRYLSELGIDVRGHGTGQELAFPAAQISLLEQVDPAVELRAEPRLAPLVHLARAGSSAAATLEATPAGRLRLSLWDAGSPTSVELDDSVAAAVCCADLPFTATAQAWAILEERAGIPHTIGRASMGHDGFVEIAAARPQLVESSPIVGLFRIADDRFGVAAPLAGRLRDIRGIAWDTDPPEPDPPSGDELDGIGVQLGPASRRLAGRLVDRLGTWGAAILCAPHGHGRRPVVAAALEGLDLWPALVVCGPEALWVWSRVVTSFGRRPSVTRDADCDARLVTWLDLAGGAALDTPASVVLDGLDTGDAQRVVHGSGASRLDALGDVARVGVTSRWPDDPEAACRAANLVRPVEFDLGTRPLSWRYPLRPVERSSEHVRAWTVSPTGEPDRGGGFRRSRVRTVTMSEPQQRAFDALRMDLSVAGDAAMGAALDINSAGVGSSISPKLAMIVEEVHASAGPVAVWTPSRRAAVLLRGALRGQRVSVCDPADAATVLAGADSSSIVVVCGAHPGDLRGAHTVIIDTLAVGFDELDAAVGPSHLDGGARDVVVVHAHGGIDDRIATWSAAQHSLHALDRDRVAWLLTPRWAQ
jgi:hypothetical protein